MSLTTVLWLLCFCSLLIAALRRPVYATSAYLMTFFLGPQFWWWGGALTSITMRWNFYAAIALLAIVILKWSERSQLTRRCKTFFWIIGLYTLNAIIVHNFAAANPPASAQYLDVLWKSSCLAFLIRLTIRNEADLHVFLFSIVALCGFIGFEVVINDAGTNIAGRLEGIGIANASGSNGIAALVSIGLILAGYFVLTAPTRRYQIASLLLAPFILDVVLRCSSRGAFLGLIASGCWILICAKGRTRGHAIALTFLGIVGVFLQANDARIFERFQTTFSSSEERDNSASERILYWKAAARMLAEHPLGSGGKAAFMSELGAKYISHFRYGAQRSVHNGFLDLLCGWGVQGFALFSLALLIAFSSIFRASWRQSAAGNTKTAFLGATLQAILIGQLICTMFTSILDGEWYLWLAACSLAYAQFPLVSPSSSLSESAMESSACQTNRRSTGNSPAFG